MIQEPLVSIITIVYNGEKHIAGTIRSVMEQTYRNLEYIIVDGGSTDNTLAIIHGFGDAVTTVISEKDGGISDAFNKGIRRATGSIIGMINADDWYAPDAVARVVSAMGDQDIVYGDLQRWTQGRPDGIVRGEHRRLHREMTINHPTVFVRRECYWRYGLFDEQYACAMDYDLLLRLSTAGCGFVHVPAVLANMRWGGVSDKRWRQGCLETMRIKDKYLPDGKIFHRIYYLRHVLAIRVSRLLGKMTSR
jgi:glycosyltransferase involved in cell wall biosynthesis